MFPNPFPALLIGFLAGVITTLLNSKKKSLNDKEKGVIDSLGSLMVFFVPALLGGFYSAILFTTASYGPDNTDATNQVLAGRSRWGQGSFQLVGMAITLGIALLCGILIGVFSKIIGSVDGP